MKTEQTNKNIFTYDLIQFNLTTNHFLIIIHDFNDTKRYKLEQKK